MKMFSKISFFMALFFFFSGFFISAQEIITAERYLEIVSEHYANIRDYEAQVIIRSGTAPEMAGNLSYLDPFFMRIDFTNPAEQVMVFNGETLTIYLPDLRATLNQTVPPARRLSTVGASMASAQGLQLLRRGYVAAFLVGPEPVPLDERDREPVIKLRLTRRLSSEGFREIILSINPQTQIIRRIEGRTIADALVRFDFLNVRTNVGIPEQRFAYNPPPTANLYNNFLFRDVD
ncbi:MAG: outer-membrane lipoprotein carrier protein LolA [Treponema sp.]|nr:outer-membrane lipoprotein carrier protein LolA [Treponema sp.]